MSDSEEKRSQEEVPDGMVRKTRRVRKKRRSSPSSSEQKPKEDANTLFGKAKELLIGMHEEDEDFGPIDVAEQVRRLKLKKVDERPLDELWGTKRRSTTWLWIILAATIFSVVAIVIGVTMWAKDEPVGDRDAFVMDDDRFKLEQTDLSGGPLSWFNENSVEVLEEVRMIISKLNEAEDEKEIVELVRDSPFREVNPIDLDLLDSPMLTNSLAKFKWVPEVVYSSEMSGAKERGYLEVSGECEDRTPYTAYFVFEENRLQLDWDATVGWSEMPVGKLKEDKPRKQMLVRCRMSKDPSFDQDFGKTSYSGYVLAGEVPDEFLFAYVDLDTTRGRAIDRDLRLLLNYGSFVTDEPPRENVRGTLRVVFREEVGEEGIFEIVEYLHDDWVSP